MFAYFGFNWPSYDYESQNGTVEFLHRHSNFYRRSNWWIISLHLFQGDFLFCSCCLWHLNWILLHVYWWIGIVQLCSRQNRRRQLNPMAHMVLFPTFSFTSSNYTYEKPFYVKFIDFLQIQNKIDYYLLWNYFKTKNLFSKRWWIYQSYLTHGNFTIPRLSNAHLRQWFISHLFPTFHSNAQVSQFESITKHVDGFQKKLIYKNRTILKLLNAKLRFIVVWRKMFYSFMKIWMRQNKL